MSKVVINKMPQYSDKKKYEAVVLYKMVGSLRAVAHSLGIPEQTVRRWHIQEWWREAELDITRQSQVVLSGNLKKVADKAIKIVEDRLDNGDFFYDQKEGKLVRRPVSGAVAVQIMRDSIDRQVLLDKLALDEKKQETEEKFADRLIKLSEQFRKVAKTKIIDVEGETIDVEVIEDSEEVHDETTTAIGSDST